MTVTFNNSIRTEAATSNIATEFSKRLNVLMVANDLSIAALAVAINVTYQTARSYTKGIRLPRNKVLGKICELFNTDSKYMLYGRSGVDLPETNVTTVTGDKLIVNINRLSEKQQMLVRDIYKNAVLLDDMACHEILSKMCQFLRANKALSMG